MKKRVRNAVFDILENDKNGKQNKYEAYKGKPQI